MIYSVCINKVFRFFLTLYKFGSLSGRVDSQIVSFNRKGENGLSLNSNKILQDHGSGKISIREKGRAL
ncbi:MAG: hypothetical protein ACMUIU_01995 [bacterium]